MKLLLDTHIWLWYLLGDKRLSSQLETYNYIHIFTYYLDNR